MTKYLNLEEKIEHFRIAIVCVGNGVNEKFLTENELLSYEYFTMFDD